MQSLFGLISALGNKVIKFGKSLGIIIITSLHIMIFQNRINMYLFSYFMKGFINYLFSSGDFIRSEGIVTK